MAGNVSASIIRLLSDAGVDDALVYIDRDGDDMVFRDVTSGAEIPLSDLTSFTSELQTFNSSDVVSGKVTITHTRDTAYPQVAIYDDNGYLQNLIIQATSTTQFTIEVDPPTIGVSDWSVRISG